MVLSLLVGCASSPRSREPAARDFEVLLDAVVRIDVREATYEAGAKLTTRGVGSGVIMTPEGHILTNAHVVGPMAEDIVVTLANLERVDATFVGWDHWTDLAVIQLDLEEVAARGLEFSVARFGDSATLYAGQPVLAVGTPNGLARTVTKGIISNPRRYFAASSQIRGYETGYFNNWLQTDAAINPGNSGGPLVSETGAVIGINTRSYLGANNLSFAVPADIARSVMAALLAAGEVERSYIGVRLAPLQDLESFFGLKANEGVLLESIDPGSPADAAGLRPGDILLRIDGEPVDGRFPEQLPPILHRVAQSPVGATLSLELRRGDETREVAVATERLETRVGERDAFEDWGLSVQEVSRAIARERKYDTADGLLVIGLQQAFPAALAGLSHGDVILAANRQPVRDLRDLRAIYEAYAAEPDRVLLEVRRRHDVSFVLLKP
ncbi:MAG: trypsin-like peptidase domain-containing protein [Verrucomicrobiota bacterium]